MTHNFITDYEIQALVDNELEHERAKNILNSMDSNPHVYERYKQLMEQKRLLRLWGAHNQNHCF
tara:strand:+ start:13437 stop:13628 length:192 start_codon:yes stop_codon:yes gene_type:complete